MTPSQLKYKHQQAFPNSHFFSRETMRFFGDTMANYGCECVTIEGQKLFRLYRKRPVKHGLKSAAYFDAVTFQQVQI